MIVGKPFQLSVMRYAAVEANAVNKLNAPNRFGSICDALVSGSPSRTTRYSYAFVEPAVRIMEFHSGQWYETTCAKQMWGIPFKSKYL